MFVFIGGMLVFFMLSAAPSVGDARTPMVLGIAMTVLNLVLNVILIRGFGPIPSFGTAGSAMGTAMASGLVAVLCALETVERRLGRVFSTWAWLWSRLANHPVAVSVRTADWHSGHCDERWRCLMLAFIGSRKRRSSGGVRRLVQSLFSLITWTSVGLMSAAAAVAGQNLGAGRPIVLMPPCTLPRPSVSRARLWSAVSFCFSDHSLAFSA